ncbi:hypothetical protein Dsin_007317 [Dipteronia sinensis]|uniref:Uncharacterized protein n=1 Tax=Dipteronia sinensis TaxID=43782 RepID=A0AAE0EIA9_9ROSI|nr:hypothetical protein Dsin_007317 [Dipteronia sinensis]
MPFRFIKQIKISIQSSSIHTTQNPKTTKHFKMSSKLEDAISIVMNVVLRKSIYIFHELACLVVDVASIMTSAVGYYSLSIRRSTVVSGRMYSNSNSYSYSFSPMSTMEARQDR